MTGRGGGSIRPLGPGPTMVVAVVVVFSRDAVRDNLPAPVAALRLACSNTPCAAAEMALAAEAAVLNGEGLGGETGRAMKDLVGDGLSGEC